MIEKNTDNPHSNQRNISPFEEICLEIDDLYHEAKNWADGENIVNQDQHDAVEKIYKALHEAGKKADALRVEEKKPLDDQVNAIQARYNPYIQPKKGKVDVGKDALNALLAIWRKKIADEKARAAEEARKEALAREEAARKAMQASRGNLEAREEAEKMVEESRKALASAKKLEKQATVGTGLRTTWSATMVDERAAIAHYWSTHKQDFIDLAQSLADADVRRGVRSIEGFKITEEKKAI